MLERETRRERRERAGAAHAAPAQGGPTAPRGPWETWPALCRPEAWPAAVWPPAAPTKKGGARETKGEREGAGRPLVAGQAAAGGGLDRRRPNREEGERIEWGAAAPLKARPGSARLWPGRGLAAARRPKRRPGRRRSPPEKGGGARPPQGGEKVRWWIGWWMAGDELREVVVEGRR